MCHRLLPFCYVIIFFVANFHSFSHVHRDSFFFRERAVDVGVEEDERVAVNIVLPTSSCSENVVSTMSVFRAKNIKKNVMFKP